MSFRVVSYGTDEFVNVLQHYDTTWTNWVLGFPLDSRTINLDGEYTWLPKERFLVCVFKDEKLMHVLILSISKLLTINQNLSE